MDVKLKCLLFILVIFIFTASGHANESKVINSYYTESEYSEISNLSDSNNTSNLTIKEKNPILQNYNRMLKFSGASYNTGFLVSGLLLSITGVLTVTGFAVMAYFCAEGLDLFDDPRIAVEFWNGTQSGWALYILAIAGVVLGSLMVVGGIVLLVFAFVGGGRRGSNRNSNFFVDADIKTNSMNLGFSHKL